MTTHVILCGRSAGNAMGQREILSSFVILCINFYPMLTSKGFPFAWVDVLRLLKHASITIDTEHLKSITLTYLVQVALQGLLSFIPES